MMGSMETREQYYFDRSVFEDIVTNFIDLDDLYDCFDGGINWIGDFLFVRDSDEYFIIDTKTLIVINWYKHLGRCNRVSKDISTTDFEILCDRIGKELRGEIDGEN